MTTEPKLIYAGMESPDAYTKESVHAVLKHILKLADKIDDEECVWYSRDIRIYIESVKK
jgi:hypothetical protein